MAVLVALSGPLEGQRIDVEEELVIGRQRADLELDDPELSRRHARITVVDDGLRIEDLGSSNGTRVNGKLIKEPTTVTDGATVKLGQTTLRVELRSSVTRLTGADPQATAVAAESEPAAAVAPGPPSDATEVRQVPVRRPAPAARRPAPSPEFGAFKPSTEKRRRGVATRLWLPAAMTYAAIGGTAAALILYFAGRS